MGVVNIVATIAANLCIDRVGRKVLLYISDAGMVASLSVFGAYFYMKDKMELEAPGNALKIFKNESFSPILCILNLVYPKLQR